MKAKSDDSLESYTIAISKAIVDEDDEDVVQVSGPQHTVFCQLCFVGGGCNAGLLSGSCCCSVSCIANFAMQTTVVVATAWTSRLVSATAAVVCMLYAQL